MKNILLIALSAFSLVTVSLIFGQDKVAKPAPAVAPQQKLQLVKVASLNTIESNREFQKNVQLVQQQRALAVQLLSQLQNEQDEEKHAKIKKQVFSHAYRLVRTFQKN